MKPEKINETQVVDQLNSMLGRNHSIINWMGSRQVAIIEGNTPFEKQGAGLFAFSRDVQAKIYATLDYMKEAPPEKQWPIIVQIKERCVIFNVLLEAAKSFIEKGGVQLDSDQLIKIKQIIEEEGRKSPKSEGSLDNKGVIESTLKCLEVMRLNTPASLERRQAGEIVDLQEKLNKFENKIFLQLLWLHNDKSILMMDGPFAKKGASLYAYCYASYTEILAMIKQTPLKADKLKALRFIETKCELLIILLTTIEAFLKKEQIPLIYERNLTSILSEINFALSDLNEEAPAESIDAGVQQNCSSGKADGECIPRISLTLAALIETAECVQEMRYYASQPASQPSIDLNTIKNKYYLPLLSKLAWLNAGTNLNEGKSPFKSNGPFMFHYLNQRIFKFASLLKQWQEASEIKRSILCNRIVADSAALSALLEAIYAAVMGIKIKPNFKDSIKPLKTEIEDEFIQIAEQIENNPALEKSKSVIKERNTLMAVLDAIELIEESI